MNDHTQRILNFIRSNRLAVIATIDTTREMPESAVLAFAENEDLSLVFGTSNKTRKYANLQKNKNVSFVIGWTDELGTVQYEGEARELSGDEAHRYGTVLAEKNENARTFLGRDDQRFFLVSPRWIRFVDKSARPEEKIEVEF